MNQRFYMKMSSDRKPKFSDYESTVLLDLIEEQTLLRSETEPAITKAKTALTEMEEELVVKEEVVKRSNDEYGTGLGNSVRKVKKQFAKENASRCRTGGGTINVAYRSRRSLQKAKKR